MTARARPWSRGLVGAALMLVLASRASAQLPPQAAEAAGAGTEPGAAPQTEPSTAAPRPSGEDRVSRLERRLQLLEKQNVQLAESLRLLREDHDSLEQRHDQLSASASNRLSGYLDLGLFWVSGDGSGIRPDLGHLRFPEYGDVPDTWVFLGDPLSTAVNSRGEPADTGDSRAVLYNPIDNEGRLSFLVNALHLAFFAGLTPDLTFNATVDFLPRGRNVADPKGVYLGDFIDIKLAYLEYALPLRRLDVRITAGKFDSILGIEYRSQESPDRITVTPSIICRYTCGRPIGVKGRLRLPRDLFALAFAVTNGTHFVEFFPFANEVDSNYFKTLSARLSTKLPVGAGLELGASGAFGAQDFQRDNDVFQWHYGFDLHLELRDLDVRAEFVQGRAMGRDEPGPPAVPCGIAACLRYMGAYGLVAYRVFNWLQPYARVDWRDALHRDGNSFVYVSQVLRVTGGVRFDLGTAVVFKAEYTHNRELGRLPQFPDDVLTTSLILKH